MTALTVILENDPDVECPSDFDCQWKLYSFGRKHVNFKDPEELGLGAIDPTTNEPRFIGPRGRRLRTRLQLGLAHFLSYYEHGDCLWFRKDGIIPAGVEFRWDGVRVAGLLVWEHKANEIGGKTFDARAKDADGFLEEYTNWANGRGFYYRIEDADGNKIDACGGYLGADYMLDEIARQLVGREFYVDGDAGYLEDSLRSKVAAQSQPATT